MRMKNRHFLVYFTALLVLSVMCPALAHETFSEEKDYSLESPFTITDSIENAKAVYARLQPKKDIDVYTFTVTKPVHLHARAFVPLVPGLEQFLPSLAVVGPGLPAPGEKLPFTLPAGYGAVVVPNTPPGKKRPLFYEPFSGTEYYDAPAFDQKVTVPGTWYVYYWDPYGMGGDYVAILGFRERFY
jgi:hypothetical protein